MLEVTKVSRLGPAGTEPPRLPNGRAAAPANLQNLLSHPLQAENLLISLPSPRNFQFRPPKPLGLRFINLARVKKTSVAKVEFLCWVSQGRAVKRLWRKRLMISLFFSGCVDPGRFKDGKEKGRRERREKKKKSWEVTFSFHVFIL